MDEAPCLKLRRGKRHKGDIEATWKRMEKGSITLPDFVAATRKVLTKHAFARPKRRCEFAAEKVLT
jgi:hypothetical protein